MGKIFILLMTLMLMLGYSVSGHAALIDMLDGTIYDTDLQLSWLQNADTKGLMNWYDANSWATNLSFAGFDNWRLPTAVNQDGSGPCEGYNCTGNEMGHLFYNELGGAGGSSILTSMDPDLALFTHLQSSVYWSGTELGFIPHAYIFNFSNGALYAGPCKCTNFNAMAVRSGQRSMSVPEPATLLLMISGLAGMAVWRKKQGSKTVSRNTRQ